jgi:hypothetical protein
MNRKLWAALAVVIVAGLVGWGWHHRSSAPAAPHDSAGSAAPAPRAPDPSRPRGEVDQQPRVVVDDDPTGALRLEGQVIEGTRLDSVTSAADGTFRFEAMPAGSFRFVADHPDRPARSCSTHLARPPAHRNPRDRDRLVTQRLDLRHDQQRARAQGCRGRAGCLPVGARIQRDGPVQHGAPRRLLHVRHPVSSRSQRHDGDDGISRAPW